MEKIKIYYGVQGNGMAFRMALDSYKAIKEQFKDAQPAKGVFVEFDFRTNFADYHPHLERYVFPALVGLANDADLDRIGIVEFIKTPELIVTYTIEQNKKQNQNEQKIQPVFG
jgi:hypothetical protein